MGHRSTSNVTHFPRFCLPRKEKAKKKKSMAVQHAELQSAGPSFVLVRRRHLAVSVKAERVSRSRWRPNTDRHETVHTTDTCSRLSELSTWGNKQGKTRWPRSKYHALGQQKSQTRDTCWHAVYGHGNTNTQETLFLLTSSESPSYLNKTLPPSQMRSCSKKGFIYYKIINVKSHWLNLYNVDIFL